MLIGHHYLLEPTQVSNPDWQLKHFGFSRRFQDDYPVRDLNFRRLSKMFTRKSTSASTGIRLTNDRVTKIDPSYDIQFAYTTRIIWPKFNPNFEGCTSFSLRSSHAEFSLYQVSCGSYRRGSYEICTSEVLPRL